MQLNLITSRDTVTPHLKAIAGRLQNKRGLMAALGKQLEIDLRDHFLKRDAKGNKQGFPRKHFWRNQVAKHTKLEIITNDAATVVIASPELMHKIKGGIITPKRAKALSIPISPEAYKAGSASLFHKPLTLISRPGKPGLLVETATAGKTKAWKLHYILLKSVRHKADPEALPEQRRLGKSILARARQHIDRIMR